MIFEWMTAVAVSYYGVVLISGFESIFCIFSYLHLGWVDWSAFCVVRSLRMKGRPHSQRSMSNLCTNQKADKSNLPSCK